MKKIPNIATAGDRCFCPRCVREVDLENNGCPYCNWKLSPSASGIPTLLNLMLYPGYLAEVSPKFFKFMVAYGRVTYDLK